MFQQTDKIDVSVVSVQSCSLVGSDAHLHMILFLQVNFGVYQRPVAVVGTLDAKVESALQTYEMGLAEVNQTGRTELELRRSADGHQTMILRAFLHQKITTRGVVSTIRSTRSPLSLHSSQILILQGLHS
jgi:hypothetical protein